MEVTAAVVELLLEAAKVEAVVSLDLQQAMQDMDEANMPPMPTPRPAPPAVVAVGVTGAGAAADPRRPPAGADVVAARRSL